MPNSEKKKAPGALQLARESLALYTTHFQAYLPLYAAFAINGALTTFSRYLGAIHVFSAPVMILVTFVSNAIFLYTGMLLILALQKKSPQIHWKTKETQEKYLPFLLINILFYLMFIVGLFLLVIPAFLLLIWYGFGSFVLLTESLGIKASFSKSRGYVKNHFWYVFGNLFKFGFLFLIAYFILYLIESAIAYALFHSTGDEPQLYTSILAAIIAIVQSGFVAVIALIFDYKLFTYLKSVHK